MKNSLTKKLLSVILAVTMVFGASPVLTVPSFAASVDDLTFELNWNEDGYTVSDCDESTSGELVIPSEYDGLSVTEIGFEAFADCTNLVSITIPDSVVEIGREAFVRCTGLTSVTIPDSVMSIGWDAFYGCTSLTSVTIPDGVTEIDSGAFGDCNSDLVINGYTYSEAHDYAIENDIIFKSIGEAGPVNYKLNSEENGYSVVRASQAYNYGDFTIPSHYNGLPVTEIRWYAFSGCTSLTSVTIPDSVTEIGSSAFKGCTSLKSVTMPDSVTEIGSSAFKGCTSLKSVTMPNSVTSIGDEAFYNCNSEFVINGYTYSRAHDYALENNIIFNSIGEVPPLRFEELTNGSYLLCSCAVDYLGEIVIPAEYNNHLVTNIGASAFENCTKLTAVIIPDTIESIGYQAFQNCVNLRSVTIPKGVKFIGDFAFGYNGDSENPVKVENFEINAYTYSVAHDYAIENSITFNSIGEVEPVAFELNRDKTGYSLEYCSCAYDFGNYTIPSEYNGLPVVGIGGVGSVYGWDGAFENCTKLTSITIPDTITAIGTSVFEGCSNLEKVIIPDSVTTIGYCAFMGCTKLKSILIPESVTNFVGGLNLGYGDSYYDVDIGETVHPKIEGFTIYGYEGSAAEEYANKNGFTFVAVTKAADESTGITVEGQIPENTVLTVKQLETVDNKVTFDITLTNNGTAVQPEGKVTVKIPVPAGLDGANCSVYRKEENGTYTDMEAVFDGANLVFTTDHFSEYVVTTENLGFIYGDVNGDGVLTPSDVVLLRRYFANYDSETETSTIEVSAGADVNGDGVLTPSDVVLLRRYFANYDSETETSTIVLGASA